MDKIIVTAPTATTLPDPWVRFSTPDQIIPRITPRDTWRAPTGTPIPEDARKEAPGDEIHFSAEDLAIAHAWRATSADLADMTNITVRETIRRQTRPGPWAFWAPLRLTAIDEAISEWYDWESEIRSSMTCGVIRPARDGGYLAWVGIGSMMRRVGPVQPTDEDARDAIAQRIIAAREQHHADQPEGWSPSTPVGDSTAAIWLYGCPITIRRGPCSGPPSSWDLQVWQTGTPDDGWITVTPADGVADELSREVVRARSRAGDQAHINSAAEARRQLDDIAPPEALHPRGLLAGALVQIGHAPPMEAVGPVRMMDGQIQALVRLAGWREALWISTPTETTTFTGPEAPDATP